MTDLIEIKNLKIDFQINAKVFNAVNGVNLKIENNQNVVLAGESGSGKTITALAITNILPPNAKITSGTINFQRKDLLKLDEKSLINIRGREIAYIFQEPTSFLNPVYTIGNQIRETIILHQKKTKKEAAAETINLLNLVKIKDPQRVAANYPHQLSGGMNQRVFIAMALACRPKLLIADEPTTSLDITIEQQLLSLLTELKKELGFSLLFITHNLSIAKKIADKISIMYKGKIVEEGSCESIFAEPKHTHTKELIAAYLKIGKI